MAIPKRTYYRLSAAAEQLHCTADDLMHLAVNGQTRLGVLFEAGSCSGVPRLHDMVHPPNDEDYVPPKDLWENIDGVFSLAPETSWENISGFVYVALYRRFEAERSGKFTFRRADLLDGTVIFLHENDQHRVITPDDLFMHDNELNALKERQTARETLAPKSETSVVRLIAGLAKMAGLDLKHPHKDAETVLNILNKMPLDVSKPTIARWLIKARDATPPQKNV